MHLKVPGDAALSLFTAGMALIPDLDSVGSCAARSLGFVSKAFAYLVRWACRGHRHLSHALLGIAIFTALTWLAANFRHTIPGKVGLMFILTVAVSGGLEALGMKHDHTADVIALGAAAAVTFLGWDLTLVPIAAGLGCGTHIAGDMCTDSGAPLLYPFSDFRFKLLPEPFSFTTGSRPETMAVRPALSVAFAALALLTIPHLGSHLIAWAHTL